MNGYRLRYLSHRPGPALTDGSALRPDTLCTLDPDAIAQTLLAVGRLRVPLREVFDVAIQESRGALLTIEGAPPLDRLGAMMAFGEIVIRGDAGDDLGASMSGGLIRVTGNAGHRVGGPDVTSRRGMTGGEIIIDGAAGDYAGFLMRRGLIAIAGRSGKSPGYRMLAGTIALLDGGLDAPGLEMQRGTILSLHALLHASSAGAPIAAGHLAEGGEVAASAMPAMLLVLRRLKELNWPAAKSIDMARAAKARWRLSTGDRFEHNKGEVLQCLV